MVQFEKVEISLRMINTLSNFSNQLFLHRPSTLWNHHVLCYILIYLLRLLLPNCWISQFGWYYKLFHEAWDHPIRDLMIHIVDKKLFDNIPEKLTAKVIRKHFPQCVACSAGNIAQKPDHIPLLPLNMFQVKYSKWISRVLLIHRRLGSIYERLVII